MTSEQNLVEIFKEKFTNGLQDGIKLFTNGTRLYDVSVDKVDGNIILGVKYGNFLSNYKEKDFHLELTEESLKEKLDNNKVEEMSHEVFSTFIMPGFKFC